MDLDFNQKLGANLRRVRERRGWSLMNVQHASIGQFQAGMLGSYERAQRKPTVERVYELAEFYGVPIADILPDENPLEKEIQEASLQLDEDTFVVVQIVRPVG